jgi:hypothetical protein
MAQSDGHNPPRLVDELVPCLAAVVDEIIVGFEDAIGEPIVAHECQTFSTGLSSGHFGGRAMMVMLAGTTSLADRCHPA